MKCTSPQWYDTCTFWHGDHKCVIEWTYFTSTNLSQCEHYAARITDISRYDRKECAVILTNPMPEDYGMWSCHLRAKQTNTSLEIKFNLTERVHTEYGEQQQRDLWINSTVEESQGVDAPPTEDTAGEHIQARDLEDVNALENEPTTNNTTTEDLLTQETARTDNGTWQGAGRPKDSPTISWATKEGQREGIAHNTPDNEKSAAEGGWNVWESLMMNAMIIALLWLLRYTTRCLRNNITLDTASDRETYRPTSIHIDVPTPRRIALEEDSGVPMYRIYNPILDSPCSPSRPY